MTENPTVAAIIPTKDRAKHLKGAIESVLNQTYNEIEVIVVDGGSTDPTAEMVAEYQSDYGDNQVVYIRNEEPQGLPAARNQATEETDAELLAFLDDDDRWHPQKIERQVERLVDEEAVGLCYTGLVSKDPSGEHVHTKRPTLEGNIYENILIRNDIGTPSTVVMTREAFENIGRFEEKMRYQEDWDLYIRLAREYEVACISKPLVRRLYHTEAMTRDVERQKEYREWILSRYTDELQARGLESEAWAIHYRDSGIMYCLNNNTSNGRREFRKALQCDINGYLIALYISALLGDDWFELVTQIKRRINQSSGVVTRS